MKFILEATQLTVQLEGFEQIWALKRRLQVPHYAITEVDYQPRVPTMQDFGGYLRFPGTSLPWFFLAGSYRKKGTREFWYIKMRQMGMVIITLKTGTIPYDKIRLTCTPEIAQSITDWWHEYK